MAYRPSHRQLQYLVALGETGHFGAAAKRCNVSQPTLSVQLRLLEEQLGAKLIDRGPGKAELTPLGIRVIELARAALSTLDEIAGIAAGASGNLGGLIRLGVVPTFGPYFMPYLLPRLHEQYPGLELYIREDRPTLLEASVIDGSSDCALAPAPVESERFVFRELIVEELLLGMPADHRLANASSIAPQMLQGERMLSLGSGHRLNDSVQELCRASGAVRREGYEGTSLDAVRQMVSIGMGLSLFPEFYAASEFSRQSSVVLRRIRGWTMNRPIGLYWRKGNVREDQFVQFAGECEAVLSTVARISGLVDA